ncbi:hypothetical protein [Streptomyces sp. NPDC006527]|uniref:hypothetical protein n=1 Tax=Streptomyces sp. NPDC006527 TaxID=3364749 RepID=UPI0036C8B771
MSTEPSTPQFAAADCLHLHHLSLGETRGARHWLMKSPTTSWTPDAPDEASLATLEAVATYVRRTGTSLASAPNGGLEMEIDRLATAKTDSIIVQRPREAGRPGEGRSRGPCGIAARAVTCGGLE